LEKIFYIGGGGCTGENGYREHRSAMSSGRSSRSFYIDAAAGPRSSPVASPRPFGYQSRAMRPTGRQLLSAALLCGIVGVAASALLGDHGVAHLLRLRAERAQIGREAFRLLQGNARLRAEIARLRSDDLYLEVLARRSRGLVRPNEVVYRFRPRPEPER
jgi:cell division protein FtsB